MVPSGLQPASTERILFSPEVIHAFAKRPFFQSGSKKLLLILLAVLSLATTPSMLASESGGIISVLEDFEENAARNAPAISHWRWTSEQKQQAAQTTSVAREPLPGSTKNGLKIRVDEALPGEPQWLTLWHTRADYLPPEVLAVRFRTKVVSGCFTLTCGSATTYFACSDVWTKPVTLRPGDWTTVEFSLVEGLERNFRRAIFSAESPVIHYTRWIQEPLRLMMDSSSFGELWIDDIELVSRPAKPYAPMNARILGEADLARAFVFATDEKEFDLAQSEKTEALRKPALLEWPGDGPRLKARQRGLEEMSFVGIPLSVPSGANAFRLRGRIIHESSLPFVVVDFLALVAPEGVAPWSIPQRGGKGFDLCLTPGRTTGMSWGFYHARRRVPNNQPITLDLPFVDFVCAYGQGELRPDHQRQSPLQPSRIVALSLVSPFGQRSADTVFLIEALEAVSIEPEPWRDYPQPGLPAPEK